MCSIGLVAFDLLLVHRGGEVLNVNDCSSVPLVEGYASWESSELCRSRWWVELKVVEGARKLFERNDAIVVGMEKLPRRGAVPLHDLKTFCKPNINSPS